MDLVEHQRRVREFKLDLLKLSPVGAVRKHITTGSTAVLSGEDYYELRSEVAEHFQIHPSSVVIVGSCRTGFSLKPSKRYAPFTDASDVDVAIVSAAAFDEYWDLVFDHWRVYRPWSETKRYRIFLRELFKGWLWPRRLPPGNQFEKAKVWAEFEDRLGVGRFSGRRSVGARLYRSWERLEAYQAIHVAECKMALSRGVV